jgi:signal transduction histidine kinase
VVWALVAANGVRLGPGTEITAAVALAWAVCGVAVAAQRPSERASANLVVVGAVIGLALLGAALVDRSDVTGAYLLRAAATAALPAVVLHLALGLPTGRLGTTPRRVTAVIGWVLAAAGAVAAFDGRPDLPAGPFVVAGIGVGLVCAIAVGARWRPARAVARARLAWVAWAAVVAGGVTLGALVLEALVSWPEAVLEIGIGATALVPLAIALSTSERVAVRVDRLLVHTITVAGLALMVGAIYLAVVLGLGRAPREGERTLLALSMLAAAIAAVLAIPARQRLEDFATRRVYGERQAPDEVLRTFGSRLSRAIPLDELMLQLAESLRATLSLARVELWTGSDGLLERAVSLPERGPARLSLAPSELTVVARAGVSGPAWLKVWLPALLPEGVAEPILRVAPVTHSGRLLGLIVVERRSGDEPFEAAADEVLIELARQVGLALHNVQLDSALQASLDEVRRQADALQASRARIVAVADAERRRIERNLHDGAQQHLVALAVKLRLARQLSDADADAAKALLEELGKDLQDAVQELRDLAHGIYPPLLMDRGLGEALRAAAGRAALPTEVIAEGIGRYTPEIEAAVYFCCLEAMQNAGKHAGDDASITVTIRENEGALQFEVADDGAGFEPGRGPSGAGFVNMGDRLGAIGGSLRVESAPGRGTRVTGAVRLPATVED